MAEGVRQGGSGIRLLLVDDEEGFVEVLAKRMSRRNMEVTVATSGLEAIQALRAQDFDVAVVDFKMEDMDGLEVLKIFKKMVILIFIYFQKMPLMDICG